MKWTGVGEAAQALRGSVTRQEIGIIDCGSRGTNRETRSMTPRDEVALQRSRSNRGSGRAHSRGVNRASLCEKNTSQWCPPFATSPWFSGAPKGVFSVEQALACEETGKKLRQPFIFGPQICETLHDDIKHQRAFVSTWKTNHQKASEGFVN